MELLQWLPEINDFRRRLIALGDPADRLWAHAVDLANTRLNFMQTNALDERVCELLGEAIPTDLASKPVRLAILGSSTLSHLHSAIRVGGLRRGIHISIYENNYGQYWQELSDSSSALHAFKPNMILLALDAHHLAAGVNMSADEAVADAAFADIVERVRGCWRLAKQAFACPILQQTPLQVHPAVLGMNEHRAPGSRATFIERLNVALRRAADEEGVDLLSIDQQVAIDGLANWHDPALWHRAKMEISPTAAPIYGDLVARMIAARQGRSYKCLVLDLDNTLWGGVIGDDGLDGIVLGQGSGQGEAFLAFQEYALELGRRGIILAVCSKNDEANAVEPFDKHPEMSLRRKDIACFVANWNDKASNIRAIAETLNIGIDSLVFVDDNPFERNLVRQELPMVAVPEVGDDPVDYPRILAAAGYFEGLTITDDDRARGAQYRSNQDREALRAGSTDLESYLRGLEMELIWRPFDKIGLQRTAQLINKTNQFNLTTRRYTENDVVAIMEDERSFGLQLRLLDRFGDNGIIAIVIGRMQNDTDMLIDTWLMSCRVLGRQVEPTTLNLIADQARNLGASRLIGEYIPTKKNGMVKEHYRQLGFSPIDPGSGTKYYYSLDLKTFTPKPTFINVVGA